MASRPYSRRGYAWSLRPPTRLSDRRAAALESQGRADALRAGSGLVVRFGLRWSSGTAPGVRLIADDPVSVRWLERGLLPTYPRGRWAAEPAFSLEPEARPGPTAHRAILRGSPTDGLSDDADAPWSDAVLRSLDSIPGDAIAIWEFSAAPGGAVSTLPAPRVEAQAAGTRIASPGELERRLRERRERWLRGAWWIARLTIRPGAGASGRGSDLLAATISAASGRDALRRLEFRSCRWPLTRGDLPISEGELLAILPGVDSPGWAARASAAARDGLPLGTTFLGERVRLPVDPTEGRHLGVVGETGMGKSSALVRLALAGSERYGVVLLDPIGDTGRTFLRAVPRRARRRVVWISPTESPRAIDLVGELRRMAGSELAGDRALGDLVDALRRVRQGRFAETPFWGPRIEETVRRALRAAAALPQGTILDAERLLAGVGRRPVGVPPESRPAVEELWERARDRPEEVDGSRRLLAEITGRPALLRLLSGPRGGYRPESASESGAIVVITGDAPAIGETAARYLLAVHLAMFWSARLATPIPGKTFLLLDEAQWYAHETVGEMLRLGRRTNLHVVVATQTLATLPEPVADALQANAADFLIFRGSPDDAREFGRWGIGLESAELLRLGRGEALLLLGKGTSTQWIRLPGPVVPGPRDVQDPLEEFRSAEPPPGSDLPDPPAPPEPPVRTPGGSTTPLRAVWLLLRAAAEDGPGNTTVRVSLDRLRRCVGPPDGLVRAAGRELRSRGLLVESSRSAGGSSEWEVDADGVRDLLGGAVGPDELAAARRRWADAARADITSPPQPS